MAAILSGEDALIMLYVVSVDCPMTKVAKPSVAPFTNMV